MYNSFRQFCERVLRIPPDPEPPPGDERSSRLFRAAPQYYKYLLVVWCLRTAFTLVFVAIAEGPAVIGLALASHQSKTRAATIFSIVVTAVLVFILIVIVLYALFSLAVLRLEYEKRWYIVTDRSLRIREGVKKLREVTFTFANIQNLSITQGPIQRALKIADLKVETAGGGGGRAGHKGEAMGPNLHTAFFHGVDNATEIKELIQQRLRALKDSGLGDHEEIAAARMAPAPAAGFLEALTAVYAEARAMREAVIRAQ